MTSDSVQPRSAQRPTHGPYGDWIVRGLILALQLAISPLLAACWLESSTTGGERAFMTFGEFLSLAPGPFGNLLRKAFYRAMLHECAYRSYISFGTLFVTRNSAVGRDTFVGPYCVIGAAYLGNGVRLGSRVSVMAGRHQHGNSTQGIVDAPFSHSKPVTIREGSWIGEGAIVMADVGRSSIVGAGAVVVRPVPDNVTVVGNPAKMVTRQQ